MYWTIFLYELYHFFSFFVSIIGSHNCSYSALLNSFLYLQIQLYDTLSLSPSCALDIVLFHKATEAKDLFAV